MDRRAAATTIRWRAIQIENSDIIWFHDYQTPERFEAKLRDLPRDRPAASHRVHGAQGRQHVRRRSCPSPGETTIARLQLGLRQRPLADDLSLGQLAEALSAMRRPTRGSTTSSTRTGVPTGRTRWRSFAE